MEKTDALKLAAVTSAAFFAGGAVYINIVEIPALFTVKDTVSMRKFWAAMFNKAKKVQGGLGSVAILTGGLSYYFDESDDKWLWAVGAGVMSTIWPWTMFVMIPDINRLLKEDVIEERGEKWVRENIGVWNKRHMFRSLVSTVAFGTFLYGLYRSK
ncbi:hypothetical protein KUTeg_008299 [Tegillarca granosa]|uniref:Uncharacterized protein n=1 Tax=Tegillarca granosa TaxID=220873 RepID=A0ABQ9FDK3_TEGGR|nr:hypothetical protein KUTeg_008299 [Tegillarca granosa]